MGVVATMTFANTASVLFDAVYVPGGAQSVKALARLGDARTFVDEAYKHARPIAAVAEGVEVLTASGIGRVIRHAGAVSAAAHAAPEQATTAEVQSPSEVGSVKLANGGGATGLAAYGIIVAKGSDLNAGVAQFTSAFAHHRFWGRPDLESMIRLRAQADHAGAIRRSGASPRRACRGRVPRHPRPAVDEMRRGEGKTPWDADTITCGHDAAS